MGVKAFKLIISVGLLLLTAAPALADSVTSFQSDATVSSDNLAKITETIVYDPGSAPRHGIYRFVPAQFGDGAGNTYYTTIKPGTVTDASGTPYKIAESHNNTKEFYLKIGDANVTFSDPHTYVITYSIQPLALRAGDHDRLILNVTGQQWDTDIAQASITLHLPAGATAAKCYTGATGSTASDCTVKVEGQTVSAGTTKPLGISEGMTVDINLPANTFSSYLLPNKKPPLMLKEKLAIGAGALSILIVLVALIIEVTQQLRSWLARRSQTVIAQYEPPQNLKPAQLGMMAGGRQRVQHITATIVDWASKGYIKIELVKPKSFFSQAEYRFTKVKEPETLSQYEYDLMVPLFTQPKSGIWSLGSEPVNTVLLSSLKKNTSLSSALTSFREHLGNSLQKKGFYYSSPTVGYGWIFMALWPTTLVLIALTWLTDPMITLFAYIALGSALITLILAIKRTGLTATGTTEWAEVEGFKLFLSVTEKDRLKFFNDPKNQPPELTPQLFSMFLPYAIALKLEKEWAKRFEGIDVSQAVGVWYVGPTGQMFSAAEFSTSIGSSLSSAVSGSFAGASGGGGAGGGGGGGGGGGW